MAAIITLVEPLGFDIQAERGTAARLGKSPTPSAIAGVRECIKRPPRTALNRREELFL